MSYARLLTGAKRCLLGLALLAPLAAADLTQLRQLVDKDRIFELRRLLQQPGWNGAETLLYRAVVAARFGHESIAIEDLHQFLATHPDPALERKTHEELASALVRLSRYGDAAQEWTEALRLTPSQDEDREGNENTRALCEALRNVAPQTLEMGNDPNQAPIQAKHNHLGTWNVPVEVNGRKGQWIFDTGANLSTVTESEALRMGLPTRETSNYVEGSTGKRNSLRLAVAETLQFGTVRLHNVVFLVLPDAALNIGPAKYQIRGILGLPVIRALGRVEMSPNGSIRIASGEPPNDGEPDLFFDRLAPIAEVRHGGRDLEMLLDTGANRGTLYPSFRDALANDEIAALRTKLDKTAGAGELIKRREEMIPRLRIEVMNQAVNLGKVSILAAQPSEDARYRDGVLGMDSMPRGFSLDFRSMRWLPE